MLLWVLCDLWCNLLRHLVISPRAPYNFDLKSNRRHSCPNTEPASHLSRYIQQERRNAHMHVRLALALIQLLHTFHVDFIDPDHHCYRHNAHRGRDSMGALVHHLAPWRTYSVFLDRAF